MMEGERNPLTIEYDNLLLQQVNRSWVIKMCEEYGTVCSDPDCENVASELFVSLYSCSFICLKHAIECEGDEPLKKIRKVILRDRVDMDMYSDFVHRTLWAQDKVFNGFVHELTKRQLAELRLREKIEREVEYNARMALRKRRGPDGEVESPPANVVYLSDVGGKSWPAIDFDMRGGWEDAIIPETLVSKKKFAPEVNESNDTGLTVEDLF